MIGGFTDHAPAASKLDPLCPRHLSVSLIDLVSNQELDHPIPVRIHVNLVFRIWRLGFDC
jgi:hypothetical protein